MSFSERVADDVHHCNEAGRDRSSLRDTRSDVASELGSFLCVGGLGYVVDVVAFNLLRGYGVFATADPALARTVAVLLATGVTYLGNRTLTWRHTPSGKRGREVALFLVFNLIGFAISVAALVISHDVMGLTSALADNISANVVGVGLGTVFRFAAYKYVVFRPGKPVTRDASSPAVAGRGAHQLRLGASAGTPVAGPRGVRRAR